MFEGKKDAFGLDISDFSLKLAKLEKAADCLRLASFGSFEIPEGVVVGGEVQQEEKLSKIIREAVSKPQGKKLAVKHAILSLPEEKSFLDILQIPFLKEEETLEAVRFEAANRIPVALEDVYFDFEKIPSLIEKPEHQEVLIAATPKKIVDSYLIAVKKAGLQPQAAEIECLAVARALIKKDTVQKPLLIIDFGETRTSFVIYAGRGLRFTSTIPVSSGGLTRLIAKALGKNIKEAEELKQRNGLEGEKQLFETMIPALTDLAEQIKTHLDYYKSHTPQNGFLRNGKTLEKILLCGGGANLKGLVNFLATELKVEVALGNPWINILKEPLKEVPELTFEKSLGYATALGLALRGIDKN